MRTLLVLLCTAAVLAPASASARPGDLDRSFGTNRGFAWFSFGSSESSAADVVVRRDRSIVAVGTTRRFISGRSVSPLVAVFLRPNGRRRATTFVDFSPGAPYTHALAVGVQPSGRIVVVGDARGDKGEPFIAIAGLTPAGRPDPTFGDGGRVLLPLGTEPRVVGAAVTAAVDRRGRILVSGGAEGHGFVRRFLPDGLPDPSFGRNGVVAEPILRGASKIAVDARDRVLLARSSDDALTLSRLLSDGTVDSSFGAGGVASVTVPVGRYRQLGDVIALPGREGYAVTSDHRGRMLVARLTPGGRRARFGTRGVARIGSRVFGQVRIIRQRGGKLVLAGAGYSTTALARLTRHGRRDSGFGRRGVKAHTIGREDGMTPRSLALQGSRLIVAGEDSLDYRIDFDTYFTVARFRL